MAIICQPRETDREASLSIFTVPSSELFEDLGPGPFHIHESALPL